MIHLEKLVKISRETFIDAFEKVNDPQDFTAYVDNAFEHIKLAEELKNKNSSYYFVYANDELAGYFKLNEYEAQSEIKTKEAIELERIYVLKKFQGRKIGVWMLDEIKKLASKMEKTYLWLGVWEQNTRAIKLYEVNGFSKFGNHPYYIGKDKQTDWLMRYDIPTDM